MNNFHLNLILKNNSNHHNNNEINDYSLLTFPQRLFLLLKKEKNQSIIQWAENGCCFRILDHRKFVKYIIPKYFKQSKFTSFQRQLNIYGFRKLMQGDEKGSYFHPFFQRNHEDFIYEMKRLPFRTNWPSYEEVVEQHQSQHRSSVIEPSTSSASSSSVDKVEPVQQGRGKGVSDESIQDTSNATCFDDKDETNDRQLMDEFETFLTTTPNDELSIRPSLGMQTAPNNVKVSSLFQHSVMMIPSELFTDPAMTMPSKFQFPPISIPPSLPFYYGVPQVPLQIYESVHLPSYRVNVVSPQSSMAASWHISSNFISEKRQNNGRDTQNPNLSFANAILHSASFQDSLDTFLDSNSSDLIEPFESDDGDTLSSNNNAKKVDNILELEDEQIPTFDDIYDSSLI